ncbi:MAG: hypothetical protein Q7S74_03815 [Nanoarchaeota archaeon]|nr:hypothetical protein [Nanoarchaeota archaeon]
MKTRRFYKYSRDKSEIGWKDSNDIFAIGTNLEHVLEALRQKSLKQRCITYTNECSVGGDVYVVRRRLFHFQNEISRFTGDSGGAGGDEVANIYEVVINSTEDWAQYLSIIVRGKEIDKEFSQRLEIADFAPEHSYLAKNEIVGKRFSKEGLWLDDIVEL